MDKSKYLLILFLVLAEISCNKRSTEDIDLVEFPREFYAYTVLDSIEVNPVLYLEKYLVATSQHIISLGSDDNRLLNIFNADNGEHIGNFGKQGEGPDEFLYIFPSSLNGTGNDLTIGDLTSIRYIKNIDRKILDGEEIKASYSISYPNDFIPLNYAFFLNDSTVCGQTEVSVKQLSCFNIYTLSEHNMVDYPDIILDVPTTAKHHLYQNHVKISPDRNKLVFAYSYFPLIKIYDMVNKIDYDIHVKPLGKQKENVIVAPGKRSIRVFDLFTYYSGISVSDKYIYALYQEMKFESSLENPDEMLSVPLSDKEIHIFSIEGEPLVKLKLEDWMNVYTVTANDEYLYFVHPEKEYYLYRLPIDLIIKKG